MFLALGMDEDYYLPKVERVVAFSPCMYENMELLRPGGPMDYQQAVDFYEQMENEQTYKINILEDIGGTPNSYKDLLYWEQISLEDRPQRFIPLEEYADGNRHSEEISLGAIDQMMIVGLAGTSDESCSYETAKRIFSELGHSNTILRPIIGADHGYTAWVTGDEWNNVLKQSIEGNETGDVQMMSVAQISTSIYQTYTGLVLVLILGTMISIALCCLCCIKRDKVEDEQPYTPNEGGEEYQRE